MEPSAWPAFALPLSNTEPCSILIPLGHTLEYPSCDGSARHAETTASQVKSNASRVSGATDPTSVFL